MSTPHNSAEKGDIAKTVLMPGDPLRARFIAQNYLEDAQLFNEVRGMLGYTGYYKGVRVSVMGSGMGNPSMGIYSYELFDYYDVENIIRVGTCGTNNKKVHIGDIIFAMGSSTNSNYAAQYQLPGNISAIADYRLLETAVGIAREKKIRFAVGNVSSSDVFYSETKLGPQWAKMGVFANDMESYALYLNAARLGKHALCITTVSDEHYSNTHASSEQRQSAFTNMMIVALETAVIMENRKQDDFQIF